MIERSKKKEDLLDKYSYHIVFGVLIAIVLIAVFNSLQRVLASLKEQGVVAVAVGG